MFELTGIIKIELLKINNFLCFRLTLSYHGSWELVPPLLLEDWHMQDILMSRKRKKKKNHRQETGTKFKIQSYYSRKFVSKFYFLEIDFTSQKEGKSTMVKL